MRRQIFVWMVAFVATAAALCVRADTVLYNNDIPSNAMAVASRPGGTLLEIEAADDFVLTSSARIKNATFTGLLTNAGTISQVVVEIYRVFPLDSNTVRTISVPTRANSPSDVEFVGRDSAAVGQLTFTTSTIATNFTALNSVQPGGIHPSPGQTTGGNGPITGNEVQFNVTFTSPFVLPPDHYFFIPQVFLSGANSPNFFWLSAPRPPTLTPFAPDLQSWTRDASLDPDWLRVGTDIVGGTTPPTFNLAFSISGDLVPLPTSAWMFAPCTIALLLFRRLQTRIN